MDTKPEFALPHFSHTPLFHIHQHETDSAGGPIRFQLLQPGDPVPEIIACDWKLLWPQSCPGAAGFQYGGYLGVNHARCLTYTVPMILGDKK